MLYVFYGTNTYKVADQANKLVTRLRTKRPDAEMFLFEGADIENAHIDELIEARGLFVEKHVVVLKMPFETTESRDMVLDRLEQFSVSQNIFILTEGALLAAHKKALTKHAEKIEEHKKSATKKQDYNVFALSDALGARNRQALWVGYVEALRAGTEPESIHGTLHWAVKSMLGAVHSGSPEEAGQKPFTYNKFKRFAENFKERELTSFSRDLLSIYHESRHGKHDLRTALERWILTV